MILIKVSVYARVSTDSKDQENSFENQKIYFEREIEKSKEYEMYQIYADKGITGTSFSNRQQFNEMLKDAGIDIIQVEKNSKKTKNSKYAYVASNREPKFNMIYIKNTSRLARNVLITDIIRELKKKSVYITFLDINKNTQNEADEMLLQLLFVFDESDSKDKSRKIIFGMKESAIKGTLHINNRIYGYHYDSEMKKLEIIKEEAEVIKTMFQLYSEGYGGRRISNYLYDNGINTRKGERFNYETIRRILGNEKYCGILVRNKWDNGIVFNKNSPKLKEESEWIVHLDKVPAIISEELFNKCKNLKKTKVSYVNNKGINNGRTEFAGKIICGICGSNYISGQGKTNRFYICRNKKNNGINACHNKSVYEKNIEYEIENFCSGEYAVQIEVRKAVDIELLKDYQKVLAERFNEDNSRKVDIMKSELGVLEDKIRKLLDLYLEDKITKDMFENKSEDINNEQEILNKKISKLSMNNNDINKEISEIEDIITSLNELKFQEIHTRDEMLENIEKITVNTIEINGKKEIRYYFKFKLISRINAIIEKYEDYM